MNILAIDTSSVYASCAILSNNEIVSEVSFNSGCVHSKSLMPSIELCLNNAGLDISDIDLFSSVAGPGSFTGVRIGVCAIKGLAQACNKPCIGVNTLDCLSRNLICEKLVCPILDARREQVYCAVYKSGAQIFPASAIPFSELASFLGDREVIFLGDGIEAFKQEIAKLKNASAAPANLCYTRASSAAIIAKELFDPSKNFSPEALDAIYLRKPQAEREYENRHS